MTLQLFSKYKIPWILKWQYKNDGDILARHFLVKWWDKFSVERIIKFINEEFPKKLHLQEKEKHSSSKSSIESILEGKSSKELTEIAKQILARAVSQE